jgi:hypothetical protein
MARPSFSSGGRDGTFRFAQAGFASFCGRLNARSTGTWALMEHCRARAARYPQPSRLGLLGRGKIELLAADGRGRHQAFLRNDEGCDAVLELRILGHALIRADR